MRWTAKAPRTGSLADRCSRLDIRADTEDEQVFLCIIGESLRTGDWRRMAQKYLRAWRRYEKKRREKLNK